MAAVRERHPQDRVTGLERRGIDRLVRLRARMRLHIGPRRAEQLLRALDRDRLGHVDVLAAAVVAPPGIAFGILVRELAALRDQHRAADVVFRGDQLDVIFLPLVLEADRVPDFGIGLGEEIGSKHGWPGESGRFYQRASMRYLYASKGTSMKPNRAWIAVSLLAAALPVCAKDLNQLQALGQSEFKALSEDLGAAL